MSKEYNFGFKHYWNYFKINYIISLKTLFEYKVDLYSSVFLTIFWNSSFILFAYVLANDFLPIIGWDLTDYFLFCLISYLIYNINGLFIYDKFLEQLIIKGDLNKYFYRPGNRFFNYFFAINFNTIFVTIGNIIMFLPYVLIFGEYSLNYFHIILLVFIISLILQIVTIQFLNSISLLVLKFFSAIYNLLEPIEKTFLSYTPVFFDKIWLRFIGFAFQSYFVAILIIPLFKGIIPLNIHFLLFIEIFLILIFSLGIYFVWKIGLKKYVGFN